MLNLIKRDIIIQKKLLLTFIPFIVFFIIMDSHPIFIFLVSSIFIPFNALAYDEKTNVNILLNSLPYTRKEIVASRYFGGVVFMVISIGLTAVVLLIAGKSFSISDMTISAGLFLLFSAISFPIFYIVKQGQITPFLIIGFILLGGAGPAAIRLLGDRAQSFTDFILELPLTTVLISFSVIALFFYAVSWRVAAAAYERKAF